MTCEPTEMTCEPTDMVDLYTSDRGSIQGNAISFG